MCLATPQSPAPGISSHKASRLGRGQVIRDQKGHLSVLPEPRTREKVGAAVSPSCSSAWGGSEQPRLSTATQLCLGDVKEGPRWGTHSFQDLWLSTLGDSRTPGCPVPTLRSSGESGLGAAWVLGFSSEVGRADLHRSPTAICSSVWPPIWASTHWSGLCLGSSHRTSQNSFLRAFSLKHPMRGTVRHPGV